MLHVCVPSSHVSCAVKTSMSCLAIMLTIASRFECLLLLFQLRTFWFRKVSSNWFLFLFFFFLFLTFVIVMLDLSLGMGEPNERFGKSDMDFIERSDVLESRLYGEHGVVAISSLGGIYYLVISYAEFIEVLLLGGDGGEEWYPVLC